MEPVPVKNTQEEPEQEEAKFLWEPWITVLHNHNADEAEWDHIEEFLQKVRQIAQIKLDERHTAQKNLAKAISELQTLSDPLKFFEFIECEKWNASNISKAQAETVYPLICALIEKLLAHVQLQASPGLTFREQKEKRLQMEALEGTIQYLYSQINAFFLDSPLKGEEKKVNAASSFSAIDQVEEPVLPFNNSGEEKIEDQICEVAQIDDLAPGITSETTPAVEENKIILSSDAAVAGLNENIDEPEIDDSLEQPPVEEPVLETKDELETFEQPADGVVTKREGEQLSDQENVYDQKETIIEQGPAGLLNFLQETARTVLKEGTEDHWQDLCMTLVREGDLAGAYWLSFGLEQRGQNTIVPSWLLAAVFGSQYLSSETDPFAEGLLDLSLRTIDHGEIQKLFALSAALIPALIAPYTELKKWIKPNYRLQEVQALAEIVRDFTEYGVLLHPDLLDYVSGAARSNNTLTDLVEKAKRWQQEAPRRRAKIKRATDVWRFLVGSQGELYQMISLVADNKQEQLQRVEELSNRWSRRSYITDQLHEIDRKIYKLHTRPIDGSARDQVVRDIEEAVALAKSWCYQVRKEDEVRAGKTWIIDYVQTLRSRVEALVPGLSIEINDLCSDTQPLASQAAGFALRRSVHWLLKLLHIPVEDKLFQDQWAWLARNTSGLQNALNKRLLWLPELNLCEDDSLDWQDTQKLPEVLCQSLAQSRTYEMVCQMWVQKQDYRFLANLSNAVPLNGDPFNYQAALLTSRSLLMEHKADLESAIEQAVINEIINEERAELSSKLAQILPETVLNFPLYFKRLEQINIDLDKARRRRLNELRKDWQELQPRLQTYDKASDDKKNQLMELVHSAFAKEDTRLIDEYLPRLRTSLDLSTLQDEEWVQEREQHDELDEFIRTAVPLEDWLKERSLDFAAREVLNGETRAGIRYGFVSKKRREEAQKAIESWRVLKQLRARTQPITRGLIASVLSYLGFTLDSGVTEPVQIQKSGEDWLYAHAFMSSAGFNRPIPQFGSRTKGQYNIICLWERPGADTIYSRLLELRLKPETVIVFYFGRITVRQRYDIIRTNNNQELAIAVLDDLLLFYLAQDQDIRLPAFLKCTLPFASLNPYTPFQAGDVPPEMFFGREDMVRDLQKPDGPCLVYGGRQLGKSALLRQVQREFSNTERQQYAQVVDIKQIGSAAHNIPTSRIWIKIRDAFKQMQIFSKELRVERSEEIERRVRDEMVQNPNRRVIILFDEADKFLEADANDGYRITDVLRTLMLDTERRFKLVFAGLHNVQRFQDDPNQPLAHFGKPIRVGPLTPRPATDLILQPLFFLGFRFADENGPMRILTYTNYHPGLIQLFCQELLTRMRGQSNRLPPFFITQADIEVVYHQVKENIRERFEWTLALHPAYQGIAWVLCADQIQARDGFSLAYSAGEILQLVRYWWPSFPNDLQLMRSLLGEMVGLGVLQPDGNGNYRLRSPNLVRLMGTDAEIEHELLQLSAREPELRIPDNSFFHAPIDEQEDYYSPLTYLQESKLNFHQHGVGLIFASEASGLKTIPKIFLKYAGESG